LTFIDLRIKINEICHCDVLLSQQLLNAIVRSLASSFDS